ncbi:hypothetical protein GCM10007919_01610 [Rhizobium indigoferae]|nr:hypothetical protein GCM10007919_01610 [Rhizobium indigoferae]
MSKSWAVPEAVKPTTVRQAHRLLNFANQLTLTTDDAELIKEWPLSTAATLGSSVRATGILMEIRARLPLAVRKSLEIEAGALTLAMAETAKSAFRAASQLFPTCSKTSKPCL